MPKEFAMLFSFSDKDKNLKELIKNHKVSISCINTINSIVLSGNKVDIENLLTYDAQNVIGYYKYMNSKYAYHSHLIQNAANSYKEALKSLNIQFNDTNLSKFISTYSTNVITSWSNIDSDDYWSKQMSNTVLYHESIQKCSLFCNKFIEIGPSSQLLKLGQQSLSSQRNKIWIASILPNENSFSIL